MSKSAIQRLLPIALLTAICFSPLHSVTAETPETEPTTPQWEVSVKAGTSFLLNGQSNALAHRLRHNLRAEFAYRLHPRLHIGGELVVPLNFDRNYRMLGGFFNAKVNIHDGDIYQFKWLGGVGLGFGPKILSTELNTEEPLRLWYQTAMQHRWTIVSNLMSIGLDIAYENLSVLSANLAIQFEF